MKIIRLLVFICLPILCSSQSVKGFIYDAETTIKGAKLVNTTQKILSYSDDKGFFEINAKLNDTIVVSSYFHNSQTIVLTKINLEQNMVIELKKITNELDRVDITNEKERQFDSISFQNTTAKHGQIAFKERIFGSGENLQPTLNLINLARAIGKLLKKDQPEILLIKTDDLLKLFESSDLFNMSFLRDDLGIPEVYEYLFFEYVQAQHIDASFLSKDKEFLLVDKLLKHSIAFNKFVAEHQKD